jgi:hypothetical protein
LECLKKLDDDNQVIQVQQDRLKEMKLPVDQIGRANFVVQCSIESSSGMV